MVNSSHAISVTPPSSIGKDCSHSSSAPGWGPSYGRQLFMNCPPHSLPTGCSSQTASLWLLPQGHKASKHTLPSVGFSLSMGPQVLPGPCSCGVTVYCRHIHLLSSGFIHRLQGDLCTPMDLQGLLQSCFSMLFLFSVLLQTLLKQVAHLVILIANASNDFNFM